MLDRQELEKRLIRTIAQQIEKDVERNGKASLLVSGGSTPKDLFAKLSKLDLPWDKVVISLVDERFVPDGHSDQNGTMVRSLLLKNKAASAAFIPLVHDAHSADHNLELVRQAVHELPRPFSVVLLGMGADGHTASLFPKSVLLDEAMRMDQEEDLMHIEPVTAPYERITFTRQALFKSKRLLLHCYGEEKKNILNQALRQSDYRPYPIGGFKGLNGTRLEVYWTN